MSEKQRLDILLHQRGLAPSREKAHAMIMAGEVLVNGKLVDKPGTKIAAEADLIVRNKPRFASRGGDKLAAALDAFRLDVTGRVCADVGASTGGFTDCLLQAGATKVYAIDVGYGLIDLRLRSDPRVVLMERTNARYLESLPEPVTLAVIDASFISLKLLLPVVKHWLTSQADVIPLIKPQFEAGQKEVSKGEGVIKDSRVHDRVLSDILTFTQNQGFSVRGLIASPIKGAAGNIEFLAWLKWGYDTGESNIAQLVDAALPSQA